ncbi:MAG: hypothetical protein HQK49_05520 [Oligoflexia bacterium]|nr:hypothetical protein [Oligoflexia bacterium]
MIFKKIPSFNINFSPYLEIVSLIYIVIPNLLFFGLWMRPLYAIPVSIGLIISTIIVSLQFKKEKSDFAEVNVNLLTLITFIAVIFFWVYLSGIGGFYFQNGDYVKHNALFYDLVNSDWPTTYVAKMKGEQFPLVYYLGYYLAPSMMEKLFGFAVGEWSCYYLAVIGMILSCAWLIKLTKKFDLATLIFFVFFCGLDFLGYLMFQQKFPDDWSQHIEWWTWIWQFSSTTTMLFWVPHQLIPGWIITALILEQTFWKKRVESVFFISTLSIMWTSFVAVGLLPYVILGAILYYSKKVFSFANIFSAIILVPILFFYFISTNPYQSAGSILTMYAHYKLWFWMPMFIFMEIGVYYLFILKKITNFKELFTTEIYIPLSFLILFALLFYRFGEFNDLAMRASIPPLIILQIYLWKNLPAVNRWYRSFSFYIFVILFIIGSIAPIHEIFRSVSNPDVRGRYISITNLGRTYIHLMSQYMGNANSFYFKYLAPEVDATTKVQVIPPDVEYRLYKFREYRAKNNRN